MSRVAELMKNGEWLRLVADGAETDPMSIALRDAIRKASEPGGRTIRVLVPASAASYFPGAPNEARITLSEKCVNRMMESAALARLYGFKSISISFAGAHFCLARSGEIDCLGGTHELQVFPTLDGGSEDFFSFRVVGVSPDRDEVRSAVVEVPFSLRGNPLEAVEWIENHYHCTDPENDGVVHTSIYRSHG